MEAVQEIDFGKLQSDNKPAPDAKVDTSKAFDASELLKGYTSAATIEETPQAQPSSSPTSISKETHYVKGPKKGQLKPNPKIGLTVNQNPVDTQISANALLSGTLFLTLLDLFLPAIIVMLNNKFSKDKMDIKVLQLQPDQKKAIAPVADQVIEQLKIKGNPVVIFVVAYLGMMAMNFMVAKTLSK